MKKHQRNIPNLTTDTELLRRMQLGVGWLYTGYEVDLMKQGLLQLESDGSWNLTRKGHKYLAEHSPKPRKQAYARKKRGY